MPVVLKPEQRAPQTHHLSGNRKKDKEPRKISEPLMNCQCTTIMTIMRSQACKRAKKTARGDLSQRDKSPMLSKKSLIIKNLNMNRKKCQTNDLFDRNSAFKMPNSTKEEWE